MGRNLIYFDHAATTPLDPRVFGVMKPYFTELYGNPSSIYQFAQIARRAVDEAREKISQILHSAPHEILFTSSGTESNNLFIFGVTCHVDDKKLPYRHLITTKIEHDSVLKPIQYLESCGFEATYLDVGEDGIVDPLDVEKALREDTLLVTVMYANNEIGTIQPISEIARVVDNFRKKRNSPPFTPYHFPYLHTDACQAAPYLNLSIPDMAVDAMTLNGGKIYGPKGVGLLFLKEGIPLVPQMMGGGQEYGKRSGTENVPAIVGFAEALRLVQAARDEETKRLLLLRNKLIDGILREIPDSRLNGDRHRRLPNNVNISFKGLEGEAILMQLDMQKIAASSGSACTSGSLEPSHVIRALRLPDEWTHSSTRFSLGHGNTEEEVDVVLKVLPNIIKDLREVSPFI